MTLRNAFEDMATEATLDAIRTAVDGLEANTTGLATQTTLAAVLTAIDGLETNTTGLATQTTLAAVNTALGNVLTAVQAIDTNTGDAATETTLAAVLAAVDGLEAALAGTLTVGGTVAVSNFPAGQTDALTDTELRATPVPVSGTVTATGTQTDALTDVELRAAPVEVDGTVDVGNFPATQTDALTDAELRATPVPVSGPLTDAQLRAAPVDVNATLGESVTVDEDRGQQRITSTRQKFWEDFGGSSLDAAKWDVITDTGTPGVTVTGSELRVQANSGGSSEYLIRSKETFRLPARLAFTFRSSALVAGNTVDVELVSVDGAGAVDGLNNLGLEYAQSVSASSMLISLGGSGNIEAPSGAKTVLSPSGSAINVNQIWEVIASDDIVALQSRDISSGQMPLYFVSQRHSPLPDPTAEYKLQIRFRMPAHASLANFIPQVLVSDYDVLNANILSGRGNTSSNPNPQRSIAVPVALVDALGVTVPVSAGSSAPIFTRHGPNANGTGNSVNTTLAAGATHTGSFFYQLGASQAVATARILVRHIGASLGTGTLVYEESDNASVWREVRRWPIPNDGVYRGFDVPATLEYGRFSFIQGSVAATNFYFRMSGCVVANPKPLEVVHYQETVTPLASAATHTGLTLDMGPTPQYERQRAFVYADQAGTISLEQSRDGTNWRTVDSQAVAAGESWTVEAPIVLRYCRVLYVNDATLQGAFELFHTLVPLGGA